MGFTFHFNNSVIGFMGVKPGAWTTTMTTISLDQRRSGVLTTRQAADWLGLSDARTICTYIKKGLLKGTRLPGGQFRVLEADLLQLQAGSLQPGPTTLPKPAEFDAIIDQVSSGLRASS